jgi:hypothetical protein
MLMKERLPAKLNQSGANPFRLVQRKTFLEICLNANHRVEKKNVQTV